MVRLTSLTETCFSPPFQVMTLNQRTIAEIKSYNNPIAEVHTCMRATLLLLGHPEDETKVCVHL